VLTRCVADTADKANVIKIAQEMRGCSLTITPYLGDRNRATFTFMTKELQELVKKLIQEINCRELTPPQRRENDELLSDDAILMEIISIERIPMDIPKYYSSAASSPKF
jgi:hypothetical protein